MALSKYKAKRNFKESPEPTGGKADSKQLRFVIQKHHATQLHYDFRLEIDGVLKSWATPKGPSTDPEVKRLAVMVEDHPFDYRNFEGVIPSGYGAGTVIIWDEGFYEPVKVENQDKKTQNAEALKQLKSGKLHFTLHGKKLKGEFVLIKSRGLTKNGWLLIKVKDKFASEDDITLKDKSVISKKTIAQLQKATTSRDEKPRKTPAKKSKARKALVNRAPAKTTAKKKTKPTTKRNASIDKILAKGMRAPFPSTVSPMLATLVDKPFDKPGWQYEVKWDGYRTLALCNKKQVELRSRNDKPFNEKFYPIYKAVQEWGIHAVIDGEITVLDEHGKAHFGSLQNWRSEADGDLYYYVFDLLWLDGMNLMDLPLSDRRTFLKTLIPAVGLIRMSEAFGGSGLSVFEAAGKLGLEGIIAKKEDSKYLPGKRSKDWLKIKVNQRQEMVIGGFTKNKDSAKQFSALLVGVYENGKLIYTGKVGTGFNDKMQKEMLSLFKPLIVKTPPFTETPDVNKPTRFRPNPPNATVYWLKPELVCEVSYAELSSDGIMRHPSFEGMRIDKKAKNVMKEIPVKTKTALDRTKKTARPLLTSTNKRERKTLLNPTEETQVREIKGHDIKFTNLNKIYWPGEGITKRDMLNYYYQVAPYIMPYLKDRPQSLNRYPNGITGKAFYQKDVTGKVPDWIKTYKYHTKDDPGDRHFLVATDEGSLLYMATLGCIEMNPWSSTIKKPDHPDWCIIDLDPAKNTFDQVIKAAQVVHQILEGAGIPCYPKTSGSTGMHIYIPLGAKYLYEDSREFGRKIATIAHREMPSFTSIERAVKDRKGKMYIDFLQNRPQATLASAYSVRPKPGATVSMPLHWEEVKKGLKMKDFTIHTAMDRLKAEGDIFKQVLGKGINLVKALKNLEKKA